MEITLGKLLLEGEKSSPSNVLVKFYIPESLKQLVSEKLPLKSQYSDEVKERAHQDTGTKGELIISATQICVQNLIESLSTEGYQFEDAHFYVRQRDNGKPQHVVNMSFGYDTSEDFCRGWQDSLEDLFSIVWGQVFVYSNPTGVVSCNFTGPQPGAKKILHQLCVSDGEMYATKIT